MAAEGSGKKLSRAQRLIEQVERVWDESGDAYDALHLCETLSARNEKRGGVDARRTNMKLLCATCQLLAPSGARKEAASLVKRAIESLDVAEDAVLDGLEEAVNRVRPGVWDSMTVADRRAPLSSGNGGLALVVVACASFPAGSTESVGEIERLVRWVERNEVVGDVSRLVHCAGARMCAAGGQNITASKLFPSAGVPDEHGAFLLRWSQSYRLNERPLVAVREILGVLMQGNLRDANTLRTYLASNDPILDPDTEPTEDRLRPGKALLRFAKLLCRCCEYEAGPLFQLLTKKYGPLLLAMKFDLAQRVDAIGTKWYRLPPSLVPPPPPSPLEAMLGLRKP